MSDLIGRTFGGTLKWDDLRIPVTAAQALGSNPPEFTRVRGTGSGGIGYAAVFDGNNDYATIPHNDSGATPVFDFASTWSMSFWAVINVGNNNLDRLFYHPQWNISLNTGSLLRINLAGFPVQLSSTSYLSGGRNHIVMIVTEAGGQVTLSVYINNQQSINVVFAGTLTADGGADVIVGAESAGTRHTACTIDDVRFWSIALTPTNVAALFNAGAGTEDNVEQADETCHYFFAEGTGNSVADENYPGPVTHTMTLTGPVWTTGLTENENAAHGVFSWAFSPDVEQELFFTVQMPHSWIQYATIEPHIHWIPSDNVVGNVVWGLEYTWANVNSEFPPTQVLLLTSAAAGIYKHQIAGFEGIAGADKRMSSMLLCRIFRKAFDAADTYPSSAILIEVDFHYQTLNMGSDEEYT